jgi:hypothetical protein
LSIDDQDVAAMLARAGVAADRDLEDIAATELEMAAALVELPQAAAELLDPTDKLEIKDEARIPIQKLVNEMGTAQKVALAMRGNKEARMILIRESNKMVCTAVIRSPRITEPEIVAAALSRSVNDEVIRIIAKSKDMTRSYNVKVALVKNPKTPLQIALSFLKILRQNDLKAISASKSVPAIVAEQARAILKQRTGGA